MSTQLCMSVIFLFVCYVLSRQPDWLIISNATSNIKTFTQGNQRPVLQLANRNGFYIIRPETTTNSSWRNRSIQEVTSASNRVFEAWWNDCTEFLSRVFQIQTSIITANLLVFSVHRAVTNVYHYNLPPLHANIKLLFLL